MADSKLVFSTGGDVPRQKDEKAWAQSPGPVKMRLESKGRGGKQVTVLFNLPFTREQATAYLKTLQGQLGTGGTITDGTIEFRGDQRDRIEQFFTRQSIKIVRAGG